MSGPRDTTRVRERRVEVARRYLQGELQSVIARDLHVTQSCISKDLESLRAEWLARSVQDVATLQQEELERISRTEQEAWQGFARSRRDSIRSLKERNAGRDKVSIVTETHVGDPRWLQVILACSARRSAITGLDATRKFTVNFDALDDSQLLRLANGESPASVLAQPTPPPMAEA